MSFAIKTHIWFAGEDHENSKYTLLDDLESLKGADRKAERTLSVEGWFDVFDEGYSFEVETHIYSFCFPSRKLFEKFLIESFALADAESVMVSHDREFLSVKTTIYIVNDREIYGQMSSASDEIKPIVFLAENQTLIGDRSFEATFQQLAAVSAQVRDEMENAMYGGTGETFTSVVPIMDEHRGIPGVQFFEIAKHHDFLLGIAAASVGEAISVIAASFGIDSYTYITDENEEFVGAEVQMGENQLYLSPSVYADNVPESYKRNGEIIIEASQSFKDWEGDGQYSPEILEDGVRRAADMFGLCVVVDIPFDGMEGNLIGYVKTNEGQSEQIAFPVADDDDWDDDE